MSNEESFNRLKTSLRKSPPVRLRWTKFLARGVVGMGTAYVVGTAIDQILPAPANLAQRILHITGKTGMSWMTQDHMKNYIETVIDEAAEQWDVSLAEAERLKLDIATEPN